MASSYEERRSITPHVIIKNLKHIVLKFVKLDYVDELTTYKYGLICVKYGTISSREPSEQMIEVYRVAHLFVYYFTYTRQICTTILMPNDSKYIEIALKLKSSTYLSP